MRRSPDASPAAVEKPTGEYRAGMPVAGDGEEVVVPARSASGVGVRQPGALGARTACARTHIARNVHAMRSGDARTRLRPAPGDTDRAISGSRGDGWGAAGSRSTMCPVGRRTMLTDINSRETSRHRFASTTAAVCGPTADVASGLNSLVPLSYFIVLSTPLSATDAGPAAPWILTRR